MLTSLLVRNVALVDEALIPFGPGLNILTGETGAGKSIVLGALNLALGQKAGADIIGRFADSAYVEATFSCESEELRELLHEADLEDCGDELIISRKILPGKSTLKINGEMVSASFVRKLTEHLLDIHGQHDHQSLLYRANHLAILDRFAGNAMAELKDRLSIAYSAYEKARKSLDDFQLNEEELRRNVSFLTFELEEIDRFNLYEGEDEEVENNYRRMVNAKRITEEAASAYRYLGAEQVSASDLTGRAYNSLSAVAQYDEKLSPLMEEIANIDGLLSDVVRELNDYLSDMEFDEQTFADTENRLNDINRLKSKYGKNFEEIMAYRDRTEKKLEFYADYDLRKEEVLKEIAARKEEVLSLCGEISALRKNAAPGLTERIAESLRELNFGQVDFRMAITALEEPTANGMDEAEFRISLNPGEPVKPLAKIASGGEMSRIMLGIKSVLAEKDEIDTLIFDEIDTGISGRTAQAVSEKMAQLSHTHQLICITHLPQIAAMADTHYLIDKEIKDNETFTRVHPLAEEDMIKELARMLGGMEITKEVVSNAEQMKKLATDFKNKYQ